MIEDSTGKAGRRRGILLEDSTVKANVIVVVIGHGGSGIKLKIASGVLSSMGRC